MQEEVCVVFLNGSLMPSRTSLGQEQIISQSYNTYLSKVKLILYIVTNVAGFSKELSTQ